MPRVPRSHGSDTSPAQWETDEHAGEGWLANEDERRERGVTGRPETIPNAPRQLGEVGTEALDDARTDLHRQQRAEGASPGPWTRSRSTEPYKQQPSHDPNGILPCPPDLNSLLPPLLPKCGATKVYPESSNKDANMPRTPLTRLRPSKDKKTSVTGAF